jgi:hypothetical protein
MAETLYTVLALVPLAICFLYFQLRQYRFRTYGHIPSPLEPNLFLGHLGYMAKGFQKRGNSKVHPGTARQDKNGGEDADSGRLHLGGYLERAWST